MKKGKLLLSLAMMCLSVAVLCFGVLAANSVTYSISGTISYEVSDVFVKINTRVYGVVDQQDKATVITNVKALETTALSSINTSTYKLTQTMVEYDSTNASGTTATHTAQTSDSKGVEIVYGTYYTYYIVINIQNLSSSKTVDAIITDNTTEEINSIKTTNLYQNNIASTETKNIVIAYSIKDKTSSVNSAAISYSLKVSYEDTDYTDPITITNDTTNSYYYLTLGKTASTETTPNIRWRLVSLDGVNKYTYNSTDNFEARYLSDAVFLQQTVSGGTVVFDAGGDNNYYNSDIRTNVKTLSNWNLTDSDVSTLISKRNITGIEEWDVDGTYKYKDTTNDYFWLLSEDEVEIFLVTSTEEKKWKPEGSTAAGFWLRTPTSSGVLAVDSMGGFTDAPSNFSGFYYVRAAFQLA